MVQLDPSLTSSALGVAGGYITLVGLVSYWIKEKLFLSESLLALVTGIVFSDVGAGIFSPLDWCGGDPDRLRTLIFEVLFTGISLPKAYLWKERLSLFTLLFPVMTAAFLVTGLFIWALIPGLTFLESLAIGACVVPTDPVLANAVVKGRYAEKQLPVGVRNIIVAEAGANDGLGFPFLFFALYQILRRTKEHPVHTIGGAIGEWVYNILLYQILLSVIIGAIIGYVARKVLKFAEERRLIDHESFLAFGVALTFFTLGIVGTLGSDDILACFVVGNSFTWDDYYRLQTEEHAVQDVIDQLLNTGIFIFLGSVLPFASYSSDFWGLAPWRLVVLGICIILFRRLPWVLLLAHWIPALSTWKETTFAGFFGPIGVAIEALADDDSRPRLKAVLEPIVYFLILSSVLVHGITIPVGKGLSVARTLTLTSRSSAGNTDNIVSRLPPAAPVPPTLSRTASASSGSNEAAADDERGSTMKAAADKVPVLPHHNKQSTTTTPTQSVQWVDTVVVGGSSPE